MRLELARVYQFTDEAQLFSVGLALDPRDAHNAQTKEAIEDLSQALQDSPSPSAHLIGEANVIWHLTKVECNTTSSMAQMTPGHAPWLRRLTGYSR